MKKISRLVSILLIATLLCSLLSSCNETPSDDETKNNTSPPSYGSTIGKHCIPTDLELVLGDGTVNIKDYAGKIVVINFWGTWCGPCKSELPHFNEVAEEYSDSVVIITVHSNNGIQNAPAYIKNNFANSKMIFAKDNPQDGYYKILTPKEGYYPATLVLDKDGVITYTDVGAISKGTLISEIEKAK